MTIPSEQADTLTGANNVILLNTDYTFLQVTIYGRSTGTVTPSIRPILEKNSLDDFEDDEFEGVQDGEIDLTEEPKKRTFTIDNKRASALRLADSGTGSFKVYIRQWGRVNH